MKATLLILAGMIIVDAVAAEENRVERRLPQARPRLDPRSQVATAGTTVPSSATAELPVVVMSPYIVRDSDGARKATLPLPIPQGAPVLSGSRFSDAVQTGNLLERTGKKFTTEVFTRGEADPGGFARLNIGYSISW